MSYLEDTVRPLSATSSYLFLSILFFYLLSLVIFSLLNFFFLNHCFLFVFLFCHGHPLMGGPSSRHQNEVNWIIFLSGLCVTVSFTASRLLCSPDVLSPFFFLYVSSLLSNSFCYHISFALNFMPPISPVLTFALSPLPSSLSLFFPISFLFSSSFSSCQLSSFLCCSASQIAVFHSSLTTASHVGCVSFSNGSGSTFIIIITT